MQQNISNCHELVEAIRNAIRREADKLEALGRDGTIKVSFHPAQDSAGADEFLGGLSQGCDTALYEYSFALNPYLGFNSQVESSFKSYTIMEKDPEKESDYREYMTIMVRVYGAGDKNMALVKASKDAITEFFARYDDAYKVE